MHAAVIGAGGPLGAAIALQLRAAGYSVTASMRRASAARAERLEAAGARVLSADLDAPHAFAPVLANADIAIFTPILTKSLQALPVIRAAGVPRVLFFSSNNVAVDPYAEAYRALAQAEGDARAALPEAIIIRPTLIYGDPAFDGAAQLCAAMRRTPVMPAPGNALQQPVFYRDLATLAVGLITAPNAAGIYAAGGPDIVTNLQFYRTVSKAVGGARLLVPMPAWAIRLAAGAARLAGVGFPLDNAQLARIDYDRRAVMMTPIPPSLTPRTGLAQGLAALVSAMDAQEREPA